MEYTYLGRTGLKVSRLCLGTMNFGPQTTEPDSYAIMDKALDLGINFFDTANVYGWKKVRVSLSRSLVGGLSRVVVAATKLCWRPKSTVSWATGPTSQNCRRTTSARPARKVCAA